MQEALDPQPGQQRPLAVDLERERGGVTLAQDAVEHGSRALADVLDHLVGAERALQRVGVGRQRLERVLVAGLGLAVGQVDGLAEDLDRERLLDRVPHLGRRLELDVERAERRGPLVALGRTGRAVGEMRLHGLRVVGVEQLADEGRQQGLGVVTHEPPPTTPA